MSNLEIVQIGAFQQRYDIRQRILNCFHAAINTHRKVLVVRLDIRFPQCFACDRHNALISEFMRRLKSHFGYHRTYCEYVWAREQGRSKSPHYHLLLLLNGSLLESGWGVREVAARTWSKLLKGEYGACIHLCPPAVGASGIMIRRPPEHADGGQSLSKINEFEAAYAMAFNWACYLAKTYTKGNAPHGVREFGSSQF